MYIDDPILVFHVAIDPGEITSVRGADCSVTLIPFTASVQSPLFTGETAPGAVDVQTLGPDGVRTLCARYAFRGADGQGNPCALYVDNRGALPPDAPPGAVIHTRPTFVTDSPVLAARLGRGPFRAEVHGTNAGVDVRVFDEGAADEQE